MNRHLACALVDLYGDLRIVQSKIQNILQEYKMALDPTTRAKLSELFTAIGDEVQEIKDHIVAGNDPTEINNELDTVIAGVRDMSEKVKASGEIPPPINPDQPTG